MPTRDPVALPDFGRDHWSTLLYLETVQVEGIAIDFRRVRCNQVRHPEYRVVHHISPARFNGKEYPTRLAGGEELHDHDDWDCIEDMVAAGLLDDVGFTMTPRYTLTEQGWAYVQALRQHKAAGGSTSDFYELVRREV